MDVLKLKATLGLDSTEYDKGLEDAEDKAQSSGSKIGPILKTVGKGIAAGLAVATGAVVAMTKSAVEGYADFEQLEGGIETLFGKSAPTVMKNAEAAFKTAGMSANEYMDAAIQSAGALINSLGGDTQRASELMDMSIVDMSDNVNKMGTSMEAVQNAYRGFSRGNFTMLDNLALGFAGTKEGMQELLDKAHELSGVEYDISSYADIVEAIHVVQENMGIAGTTAKEASETISGSLNAVKSAWANLLVGLANGNADISTLIDQLVESAITAVGNLIPAIRQSITGIAKLVKGIAPIIAETLPSLISDVLPDLLDAATTLLTSFVDAIFENLPAILEAAIQIVQQIATGIVEALPELGPAVIQMMASLITMILENLPVIIDIGLQLVQALAQGILNTINTLPDTVTTLIDSIVQFLTDNLPKIIQTGMTILMALIKGLLESIPQLVQAAADILVALIDYLLSDGTEGMLQDGIEMVVALIEGLMQKLPDIIQAIFTILTNLIQSIVQRLPEYVTMGVELVVSLITGLMQALPDIIQAIIDIVTALVEYIIDNLPMFIDAAFQIITSLAQALIDNAPEVLDAMLTLVESLITLIIDNLGEFVAQGLEILISIGKGIAEAVPELLAKAGEAIKGLWDAFVNVDWGEVGGNIIDGIKDGIGGAVSRLWNAAVNAAKTALAKIKNVLGIASPSKVFRDQVGKMIPEGMAIGIEANTDSVEDAMADIADLTTDPFAGMSNIVKFPEQGKGGQTYGGIVLNVYASEGMDVEEFADYTIDKLNQELEREGRALA